MKWQIHARATIKSTHYWTSERIAAYLNSIVELIIKSYFFADLINDGTPVPVPADGSDPAGALKNKIFADIGCCNIR